MSAPQHPNSSKTRRQARFSVLSTLLFFAGIVGLPTMAVYGFCCWLGPWWQ